MCGRLQQQPHWIFAFVLCAGFLATTVGPMGEGTKSNYGIDIAVVVGVGVGVDSRWARVPTASLGLQMQKAKFDIHRVYVLALYCLILLASLSLIH